MPPVRWMTTTDAIALAAAGTVAGPLDPLTALPGSRVLLGDAGPVLGRVAEAADATPAAGVLYRLRIGPRGVRRVELVWLGEVPFAAADAAEALFADLVARGYAVYGWVAAPFAAAACAAGGAVLRRAGDRVLVALRPAAPQPSLNAPAAAVS